MDRVQKLFSVATELCRKGIAIFATHCIKQDGNCSCGKANCSSPGKHPRTKRGCKDHSTSIDELMKFTACLAGEWNLAIATGEPSGIIVIDVEREGLQEFAKLGDLPETVTVETGGGGRHFYFRLPPGHELSNKVRVHGLPVDVRTTGGYVIAPGANHISGGEYKWINSISDVAVAECPEWLLTLISRSNGGHSTTTMTVPHDLASHSGEFVGRRHETLKRLILQENRIGKSPTEIRRLALEFRDRCENPSTISDDEVEKLIDWSASHNIDDDDPDIPLPPCEWPEMNDVAFHGLLGEIVRAIEPETEADPVAILLQALARFGVQIGRSPYFRVDGVKHHTNQFLACVGRTGRGRKGTAAARVRGIFEVIDGDFDTRNVLSSLTSGEGVIEYLRDPTIKQVPTADSESGVVTEFRNEVVSPGATDKRLQVIDSELARIFTNSKREGSILSMTLRDLWDGGNAQVPRRKDPASVTNAHLTVVGHITEAELERSLSHVELSNGLANRFLWVVVKRRQLLPEGGANVDMSRFTERLRNAIGFATSVEEMVRDEEARTRWREIYLEIELAARPGMFGAVTERASAHILRLSMIYALVDQSATILLDHVNAAKAVWDYCEQSARLLFGKRNGDVLDDRILDEIKQQPGISQRDLQRKFTHSIPKKALLVPRLASLRDEGLLHDEQHGKSIKLFPGPAEPVKESRDEQLVDFI